jgi:hypothetical protein
MRLPNGKETMSVGDLQKVMEGLDDSLPVEIFPVECNGDEPHGDEPHGDEPHGDEPHGDEPHGDEPHGDEPHGDYVPEAKVHPDSGISSKALHIYLGEGYWL